MEIKIAMLNWDGVLCDGANLLPHAADTLRWLNDRGIKVFIVSAGSAADILARLASLTYNGETPLVRFVAAVCGNMTNAAKIAFLSEMINDGAEAKKLVFVDDDSAALAAAKNAGLQCHIIGVATGRCSYEDLSSASPTRIVHNLKTLQGYINFVEHNQPQKLPENENDKNGKTVKHSGR